MSIVRFIGPGPLLPMPLPISLPPVNGTTMTIAASASRMAWVGRVRFQGSSGTKDITRVQFGFGTVTNAGGSALTVSLQNIDLANGPVIRPDGTQDQTVAIANADAGFVTNGWYRTNAFSANRTVSQGDLLGVVIEFDGAGRLGADTVTVTGLAANSVSTSYTSQHQGACVTFIAGVWANVAQVINVLLEFSDGTFGTLSTAHVASTGGTIAYNLNTAVADEWGFEFQVNMACEIDGYWTYILAAAGSNFEVIVYNGTTIIGTLTTIDMNASLSGGIRTIFTPFERIPLAANTTYRIGLRPTTAGSITVYYYEVSNATHWEVHSLGNTGGLCSRLNQGAWLTTVANRRLFGGLSFSGIETNLGVGGGTLQNIEGGFTRA